MRALPPAAVPGLRARSLAITLCASVAVHGGALLLVCAERPAPPGAAPVLDVEEVEPSPTVDVDPAPDLAPALKLGGTWDRTKLPDRWVRQAPQARAAAAAASPADATRGEDGPQPVVSETDAGARIPPPDVEVAKQIETTIPVSAETPPANVPVKGHADGIADGTETDPLEARAVDIYRDRIRVWFSQRFRVSGSGLGPEEITRYRVAATIEVSSGRTVTSYVITPSGHAAFDAAARAALEGARGKEIPPPPENYPNIVQHRISLTFTCTPERCD
ncbi:TonB C-terminal domain-containing protein [Polyangium mundeleinium]|uniref:TonB C-terminal domain-containing protein n=1 Tax=Polyangium mundeleinium TaxID=2995306 RepID=A0ABT5EY55_9BACT|nr:TonB C-terminal domain-containing protein [Polyangium mundeleinium]MDC0746765.1 TonB C-terminal domain-containing protein [Polyangium mundeleinium]